MIYEFQFKRKRQDRPPFLLNVHFEAPEQLLMPEIEALARQELELEMCGFMWDSVGPLYY